MSSSANLNQVHYRVRTDTGAVDATPTWAAAEDVAASIAVETTFRVRFVVQNTGTAFSTAPFALRVSKNGGTYTAVTTTSGATLGAQSADASSSADGDALNTQRLTAGTGTYTTWSYDETGSIPGATLPNGQYCEIEWGLILKTAGATAGDVFDFRIYHATSTAFTTYSQTARVVVPQTGTDFQSKSSLVFTYSHYDVVSGHNSSTATIGVAQSVGDLVVVSYALDNVATTDSDESACTGITDSAGNTYTKAREWTKSGAALGGGSTVGIWYCQLTNAITTSTTITATWTSGGNRNAVAMNGFSCTVTAGKAVTVEATNTAVGTSTTLASLNATTANIECLRVRSGGLESNQALTYEAKATSGWTAVGAGVTTSSGTAASSQSLVAEFRVNTGTGAASAPAAFGTSVDHCSVYVAFKAGLPNHACLANDVSSASSVTKPNVASAITAPSARLITSYTPGAPPRNDVTGEGGLRFAMTANKTFTAIGVLCTSGNSGFHRVNLYNHSTRALLATAAIDLTGKTAGNYYWSAIPSVTLDSGTTYALVKELTSGDGQVWADIGPVTLASVASTDYSIYRFSIAAPFNDGTGTGQYAGVDLGWEEFALLANDVKSNSSVSTPTAVHIVPPVAALANDVKSNSAVTNPVVLQRHNPLANDALSPSSVTQPAVKALHGVLANDVKSNSSVTQPSQLKQLQALLANDVLSGSSVKQATALINRGTLANDIVSASIVIQPAVKQLQGLLANDILSASLVSNPTAAEVGAGGGTASIVFEAVDSDGATIGPSGSYTFPLTVSAASGAGRLVFLAGIFDAAVGDFSSCTIDGQTATRVASKVVGAYTDPVVMTAYLAPGTANTSINVVATVSGSNVFSGMCALYKLGNVDTLYDSTSSTSFDPDLSVDTVAGGVVAAATYGFDSSVPQTTAWTGLTENFDSITVYGTDIFSGASSNIATASTPLTVVSDSTSTFNSSSAGLALSFSPLSGAGENACLANDIVSASSVTRPAVKQLHGALANDVLSPSSVTIAAALILRNLLANDVKSPSSVGQPAVHQGNALLANDVKSPSSVTTPVTHQVQVLDASNVISLSSVTSPAVHQGNNPVANDVLSASSVSKPAAGEIVPGQPLANDIVSQSSVSRPTLVLIGVTPPVTVPSPVPPAHGGGAGYVGAKQRQLLSETVEAAYRKALKLDEVEVVEAIRKAVKEAIPERPVQEPSRIDFERLASDLRAVKGLLAEIEQRSKAIEIQSALDALIAYEIALEEDDMEVLLLVA